MKLNNAYDFIHLINHNYIELLIFIYCMLNMLSAVSLTRASISHIHKNDAQCIFFKMLTVKWQQKYYYTWNNALFLNKNASFKFRFVYTLKVALFIIYFTSSKTNFWHFPWIPWIKIDQKSIQICIFLKYSWNFKRKCVWSVSIYWKMKKIYIFNREKYQNYSVEAYWGKYGWKINNQ